MNCDKTKPNKKSGFTLLLALLATSFIMAVSFGVLDIVVKEIRLSSLGKDSQIAFYAADAGAECALYWDWTQRAFSQKSDSADWQTINCAGKFIYEVGSAAEIVFNLDLDNGSCAKVDVKKSNESPQINTRIRVDGYNLPCGVDGANKVERSLVIVYYLNENP